MEQKTPLDALRENMILHGLNAIEVAAKADLGRDTVSRWLSGARTPRINELERALHVFGLRLTVTHSF